MCGYARSGQIAQIVQALLAAWRRTTDRLRSIQDRLTTRLLGRRNTFYAQTALRLCRTYRIIAWEGDLDLRRLAAKQADAKALEAAQRYRQCAGLSKFRQALRQAAAKTGTTLLDCPAAGTTITCHHCGARVANTGALLLTCGSCGTAWDQDLNAAQNLLAHIPTDGEHETELRTRAATSRLHPFRNACPRTPVPVTAHPERGVKHGDGDDTSPGGSGDRRCSPGGTGETVSEREEAALRVE